LTDTDNYKYEKQFNREGYNMTSQFEYMLLATRVYAASNNNKIDLPQGWSQLDWEPDRFTGFSAGIYKNDDTGEIVISYTGTNDKVADPISWTAGMGAPAPQIFEAMSYYFEFRKAHPEATNISFTGHSLGGRKPWSIPEFPCFVSVSLAPVP
jgi:hypothetical protein